MLILLYYFSFYLNWQKLVGYSVWKTTAPEAKDSELEVRRLRFKSQFCILQIV